MCKNGAHVKILPFSFFPMGKRCNLFVKSIFGPKISTKKVSSQKHHRNHKIKIKAKPQSIFAIKDRTQKCSLNKNSNIVDNFLNPVISKLKLIYTNDNIQSCLNSLLIKYSLSRVQPDQTQKMQKHFLYYSWENPFKKQSGVQA